MERDMLNALACPDTKQPLTLVNEQAVVDDVNQGIITGALRLDSSETLPAPVQALLVSADGQRRYPIVEEVPFLRPGHHLVNVEGARQPPRPQKPGLREAQRTQMAKFAQMHERWYGTITRAQQSVLRNHYYTMIENASVIDLGNGGLPAEGVFGADRAARISSFYALDASFDMLSRNGHWRGQVIGDARAVPFRDQSVDYALINGVIHHLGLARGDDPVDRVRALLDEAMRVARRGAIIMELLVPPWGQWLENRALSLLGQMTTFVYSRRSLINLVERCGYTIERPMVKKVTDLQNPWDWTPPILDLEWFRVPVGLIPYEFIFFMLARTSSAKRAVSLFTP